MLKLKFTVANSIVERQEREQTGREHLISFLTTRVSGKVLEGVGWGYELNSLADALKCELVCIAFEM